MRRARRRARQPRGCRGRVAPRAAPREINVLDEEWPQLHRTEWPTTSEMQNSRAQRILDGFEWWPEGFFLPPWGGPPWLWIYSKAAGRVLALRPSQLLGKGGLLAIVPRPGFWRHYMDNPAEDWDSAAAKVLALCYEAGHREPPEGVSIRGPGRPRCTK